MGWVTNQTAASMASSRGREERVTIPPLTRTARTVTVNTVATIKRIRLSVRVTRLTGREVEGVQIND
jgi:hypothetical protein